MDAKKLLDRVGERQASKFSPFLFPVFGYVYPLRRLAKLLARQLAGLVWGKHAVLTKRDALRLGTAPAKPVLHDVRARRSRGLDPETR